LFAKYVMPYFTEEHELDQVRVQAK
jgi:hypothetical protein